MEDHLRLIVNIFDNDTCNRAILSRNVLDNNYDNAVLLFNTDCVVEFVERII